MDRRRRKDQSTSPLGRVSGLFRYPVKSMRGEVLATATFDERGLVGDRIWAATFDDGRVGSGKSWQHVRRIPGLLDYSAATTRHGVVVRSPDDVMYFVGDPALDVELSAIAHNPIRVQAEGVVCHFDTAGVHLLSSQAIEDLKGSCGPNTVGPQRFRPNVLLDLFAEGVLESDLIGRCVAVGRSLVVLVNETTERCVMVSHQNGPLVGVQEGSQGVSREGVRHETGCLCHR